MGQSIVCVWCGKPLLDAEHAKKHVAEQCAEAPWRKHIDALKEENTRLLGAVEDAARNFETTAREAGAQSNRCAAGGHDAMRAFHDGRESAYKAVAARLRGLAPTSDKRDNCNPSPGRAAPGVGEVDDG